MAKWLDPAFETKSFENWPKGWYQGGFVAELTSNKGDKVTRSVDQPSQNGDSRNITLCCILQKVNKLGFESTEMRNFYYRLNYRPADLDDSTIERVRARAIQMKGQFPAGDPDWRPFMSFQGFRQLELVNGAELSINGHGMDISTLIGKMADFRIKEGKPNEQGKVYMEIAEIAPTGSHVKS